MYLFQYYPSDEILSVLNQNRHVGSDLVADVEDQVGTKRENREKIKENYYVS